MMNPDEKIWCKKAVFSGERVTHLYMNINHNKYTIQLYILSNDDMIYTQGLS